jgi:hypothetical protein
MTRAYLIQLQQDYEYTYRDFIQVSEMILSSTGKKRQALLNLQTILKNTIKVMEKEINKCQEQ